MRLSFPVLILWTIALLGALNATAQTCTGSLGAPVINETFGAGTSFGVGPQLPNGATNLIYIADRCGGEDDTYTLLNTMGSGCKGGTWQVLSHDHTGDPYGYMMIINAAIDPSLFFTEKVDGSKLCPNTTYQFAAWIMNILVDLPVTQGYSQPNITFSIETASGTVLKTYNTGNIPAGRDPVWKQYGTFFTTPSDGSDIVVKMINNGSGGNGNDLAMDDITFSPCGQIIRTGFNNIDDNSDKNACVNDNLSYNLVADETGYTNPTIQWQENKNDGKGWIDVPGATTLSLAVDMPNAAAGEYQYRIGLLNKVNIGSENCRIFSDPLNINVFPAPVVPIIATTSACEGRPLQLNSSGGDTFLWTGPNNFTSTNSSPVVTENADPSFNGVYTVKVTQNNCPFFAATTVNVYPAPTVNPINNVQICEGDVTQLNVNSMNATNFKWLPSGGLDHDDIRNPIAGPLTTTTYIVTVSNNGCTQVAPSASVTVTVNKKPVADAGKTVKILEGQTAKLNGTVGGDNISYYWTPTTYLDNPLSLTPVTSSPSDITYTLHTQSEVNCGEATSSVFVRVYKTLTVVNTFTPNGDGINDYWDIKNIDDYPNAEVNVYDRYGQVVFKSIGYSKPWDGTYNGKKAPVGTYYYIIDLKDDNLPKQAGWVLVVR